MQIDSWQLKIMVSADDDVHVSLDGGTAKGAKEPSVDMRDGVLDIVQAESEDTVLSQFYSGQRRRGDRVCSRYAGRNRYH